MGRESLAIQLSIKPIKRMNIQNTIDQNTNHLNYLKRQVELTELKIQNLKLIQDQGNLTTEEEKKGFVKIVYDWVRTGNIEALKHAISSNY
jgi:hypothetical protein